MKGWAEPQPRAGGLWDRRPLEAYEPGAHSVASRFPLNVASNHAEDGLGSNRLDRLEHHVLDQTAIGETEWPHFDQEMIDATARVLRSGRVSYKTGQEGKLFEAEFARILGVPHALAVANGTMALEIALESLGIGPGDDVVVTPRSFVASAACTVRRGARPIFADIDPDSGVLTAETIEAALTPATRAVIVVHLSGWPCDMDPIVALARRHGLLLVEDVAQATGGTYKGMHLGSFGDAAAFSFCQDKIVSTGEGGLITVADEAVFKRAWALRDQGSSWDVMHGPKHPPGFIWSRHSFGTNARMPEVEAAIGRVALRRLPSWLAERRRNAEMLKRRLRAVPALRVPIAPEGHAYYRVNAYVRREQLAHGWTRDRILAELHSRGVVTHVGCGEIYREEAFVRAALAPPSPLPNAHELAESAMAFAVHPGLTEGVLSKVGDVVEEVMDRATR